MRLLNHIPAWLKNKYFIAFAVFASVMLVFDKNDIFTQAERKRELNNLQKSKQYFTEQINAERAELDQLRTNPATLEKYAREKYLMKRENEDLFLITENYDRPQN